MRNVVLDLERNRNRKMAADVGDGAVGATRQVGTGTGTWDASKTSNPNRVLGSQPESASGRQVQNHADAQKEFMRGAQDELELPAPGPGTAE